MSRLGWGNAWGAEEAKSEAFWPTLVVVRVSLSNVTGRRPATLNRKTWFYPKVGGLRFLVLGFQVLVVGFRFWGLGFRVLASNLKNHLINLWSEPALHARQTQYFGRLLRASPNRVTVFNSSHSTSPNRITRQSLAFPLPPRPLLESPSVPLSIHRATGTRTSEHTTSGRVATMIVHGVYPNTADRSTLSYAPMSSTVRIVTLASASVAALRIGAISG